MARTIKTRGKVVILEFSSRNRLFRVLYEFYTYKILPRIGGMVSASDEEMVILHCHGDGVLLMVSCRRAVEKARRNIRLEAVEKVERKGMGGAEAVECA